MQKLRPTDGSAPHKKHALYHVFALQSINTALSKQLISEATPLAAELKKRARATEDAEDTYIGVAALADAAEIVLEDCVRMLDTELSRLDQKDATLNAQLTVFPNGFGEIIDPEGEVQLTTLPKVYVPVAAFKVFPDVDAAVTALTAAEKVFKDRLADETAALAVVDIRFAEEREARRLIREQLESAYGRLLDMYKGRAKMAERPFYKEKKKRKPTAKPEGGGAPPGNGTP